MKTRKHHHPVVSGIITLATFAAITILCTFLWAGPAAASPIANPTIEKQPAFAFVVIGDTRTGIEIFKQQIRTINLLSPDFVIDVGDLINGYVKDVNEIRAQWDEFDSIVADFTMPLVLVPGNHDIWDAQSRRIYEQRYGPKYFSFNHKDCHFIVLNTECFDANGSVVGRFDEQQYKWLKADLDKHSKARLTFVFLHKPFWERYHVPADSSRFWDSKVHPLLVKYGVDAVFAGHIHRYTNYGRRDGISYYVTGGGGAERNGLEAVGGFHHYMLVTVRAGKFQTAIIRTDGIVDENIVTKQRVDQVENFTKSLAAFYQIKPGSSGQDITLSVINPFDKPVNVTVDFESMADSAWRVKPARPQIALAPGQTKKLTVNISHDPAKVYPLPFYYVSVTGLSADLGRIPFRLRVKPAPVKCRRASVPPKIDGNLDEACWKKAQAFGGPAPIAPASFVVLRKGIASTVSTIVRTLYDNEHFYIAFECEEPQMDKIKADETERDGQVFNDDCVEFFIDHEQNGRPFIQICTNTLGTIFDSKNTGVMVPGWNADWQVAASKSDNGWSVEIALNFISASIPSPRPGTCWNFNANRTRVGAESELSSWSFCHKGYHEPESFATIVFE